MPVTITEKAAGEVSRLIAAKAAEGLTDPLYLRLRIVGGGCSGYQHKLDLDTETNPKMDEKFEQHGVTLLVDRRSLLYADGATIDFNDSLDKRGFRVDNPNAKGTCGCGSSFTM
jgi:iron-sulfur cluster assembly accessory protein